MPIEKEFAGQLADVGNKLLQIPLFTQQLLLMLDQAEVLLQKVGQAPSIEMQSLISPYKKSLIQVELLQHPDNDVRIAAINCICEVARITAPDSPYDDNQMKEIFKLIVFSFGSLSNPSNPSYTKAINILKLVASIRLFVVMLDMECDDLVVELFRLFLTSITSEPLPEVFEGMETIMTCLIEEGEDDVALELGSHLFDCVDDCDPKATPFGKKLGKKILENCSARLRSAAENHLLGRK